MDRKYTSSRRNFGQPNIRGRDHPGDLNVDIK
jgi:hypothetical protein